jgi:hypothetical protein
MKNARKLLAVLVCFATMLCLITAASATPQLWVSATPRVDTLTLEQLVALSVGKADTITVYDHDGNPHVVPNGTIVATVYDADDNVVEEIVIPPCGNSLMHVPYDNSLRSIPAGGRIRTFRYTLQPNDTRILFFGFENSRNNTGTSANRTLSHLDVWGSQDIGDNGRDVHLVRLNNVPTTHPVQDFAVGRFQRRTNPLTYYYSEFINTQNTSISLRLFIARYS